MEIVFLFLFSVVMACFIHESGHYLIARLYGETIHFTFELGTLWGIRCVPRFIWYMPELFNLDQRRNVALAGFGFEFAFVLPALLSDRLFGTIYFLVAIAHIGFYHLYAGESSDFYWFKE